MANGNGTASASYAESVSVDAQNFQASSGGFFDKLKTGFSAVGSKVRSVLERSSVGAMLVAGFDRVKSGVKFVAEKVKGVANKWFGQNQPREKDADDLLSGITPASTEKDTQLNCGAR